MSAAGNPKPGWNGMICASIQGGKELGGNWWDLIAGPCTGSQCSNFEKDACTAGPETTETYREVMKPETVMPACPQEARCHWNVVALRDGERGCAPRMLGLICEHQAVCHFADLTTS